MTTRQAPLADADGSHPRVLKFGVVGTGAGILSAMRTMPNVDVVALADIRLSVVEAFQREFGGRGYDSIERLCQDPEVDAVWVATPNAFHAPHTILAAQHGKHVVVEKPMTISLQDAEAMIEAAEMNRVKLLSGHTRAFDPMVQTMWRVVRSGEVGGIKAMNVWAFTDWMLRPRLPHEMDPSQGGGVTFRQAPHQIDTLRFLGGGLVRSVRGMTGTWMEGRMGAPGYHTAYLEFDDGTPATLAYDGYGYFLASELLSWEQGAVGGIEQRDPEERAKVRKALHDGTWDDAKAKNDRSYGGSERQPRQGGEPGPRRSTFTSDLGLLVLTCQRGALRQSPLGIYVYNDEGVREEPTNVNASGLPGGDPTLEEAYNGIVHNRPIFHDGRWGMATLEVQLALMQSAQEHREVALAHQVAVPADLL